MQSQSVSVGVQPHYDLLIIGGGINGCGIARDATGRGFSACLCEAGDFGSGTSSASTKLIHGGLRYLEHYEFRLVRKALKEREILWKLAPHIIWPVRFVLPHHNQLRPAWLLRLGLFIYDHLGGRKLLPPTKTLDLRNDETGNPLKTGFTKAFEYSDCWVEDSRLVILNAMDAAERGCDVRARTKVTNARRVDGQWQVDLLNSTTGNPETVTANVVINAAGPWVDEVLRSAFSQNDARNVRLVRGSHIVIRKKFNHDKAYIFQNADDRIAFAIPYEGDYTLIGTTDADHGASMDEPEITDQEVLYLCDMASEYFAQPVVREDVVWSYSGVRPLYDDGASKAQEATRDYVIKHDGSATEPRLINVIGGKITTYRVLAEAIMADIEELMGERKAPWTADAPLPGGDFSVTGFDALVDHFADIYPFVPGKLLTRLVRQYGTRVDQVLGGVSSVADMGQCFGGRIYEFEIRYLMAHEWAQSSDDVLFRRTRLGIAMSAQQRNALQEFMDHAANSAVKKTTTATG